MQNPHTWFYIDVKDDAGSVTNWGMEVPAQPARAQRLDELLILPKAGDVVSVEGYGAKDAKNIGNARTIVIKATGQRLVAGSSAGSAP